MARLGGDEFCVLLPRVDALSDALEVAERIIAVLGEPLEIDGMVLGIEASCGIAMAPHDGDNADLLLQRADVAMYVAKGSNVNVVAYTDELNVNTPSRLTLLGDLRTAIAEDQLVLHYQPKANLQTGQIQGVEALVRWQHPTLGLLPPCEFIPVAEHTGLIKPLTTWVLDHALCVSAGCGSTRPTRRGWMRLVDGHQRVDPEPARRRIPRGGRRRLSSAADVPAHLLELEVTESAIMTDPERARRLLTELADLGVRIAIDDFGTGYSSLAYLKDLPVNQLKIDQSFVQTHARRPERRHHRPFGRRPRAQPRSADRGRRGGRPRDLGPTGPARLRRRPGILPGPADAAGRSHGLARAPEHPVGTGVDVATGGISP